MPSFNMEAVCLPIDVIVHVTTSWKDKLSKEKNDLFMKTASLT